MMKKAMPRRDTLISQTATALQKKLEMLQKTMPFMRRSTQVSIQPQKQLSKRLTVDAVNKITQRFADLNKKQPWAVGKSEKVMWLHALEKSNEILFTP